MGHTFRRQAWLGRLCREISTLGQSLRLQARKCGSHTCGHSRAQVGSGTFRWRSLPSSCRKSVILVMAKDLSLLRWVRWYLQRHQGVSTARLYHFAPRFWGILRIPFYAFVCLTRSLPSSVRNYLRWRYHGPDTQPQVSLYRAQQVLSQRLFQSTSLKATLLCALLSSWHYTQRFHAGLVGIAKSVERIHSGPGIPSESASSG